MARKRQTRTPTVGGLRRHARRKTRAFGETVFAQVRTHRRRGRRVRGHPRRVHRHRSLVGPHEKLYPWGTLYTCSTCGEPVIKDERAVRRFGPRRRR